MSCKKEKRLQSKKRKLEVLLELVEKDEPAEKKFKQLDAEVNKSLEVIEQKVLTSEELANLRARLRERQKIVMQLPKIFLTLDDLLTNPLQGGQENGQEVPVIYPRDIQHLLLYALQGPVASFKPRWCKLLRQIKLSRVVVVVIESVSCVDFAAYPDSFQYLVDNFPMKVQVISPSQYGKPFAEELFRVPMSTRQLMFMNKQKYGNESDNGIVRNYKIVTTGPNDAKTDDVEVSSVSSSSHRVISCIDLLMHEEQMRLEGYPLPLLNSAQLATYKFSKPLYTLPNDFSPLFAIDCEMVRTKTKSEELAWVAVVNEKLECVYQSLVKPRGTVIDYVTQFSGVSESLLKNVTTTLKDVQQNLRSILPSDAVLVGQSLNNDLHALEMFHPYVIDTSVIYNLSGTPSLKPGLKRLTSAFLGRDIQMSKAGHNPCEDAVATMELVLQKLKHGFQFGNVLNGWTWNLKKDVSPSADKMDDDKSVGKDVSCDLGESNDLESKDTESNASSESTLAQRKSFFQRNSNSQSLFDMAKRSEKSVAVIGFGKDLADDAEVLDEESDESDKTVAKRAYTAVETHFMVCSRFQGVAKELQQTDRCNRCVQRAFQDVTKQLKRVVKHSPPSSLVVVVLTGKSDSKQTENGLCFVRIPEQLPENKTHC